ncbi:polyketide synthase HetM-like [Folsomia candida]|nr:polyketide synthase HetM-like [Folsomia candida]
MVKPFTTKAGLAALEYSLKAGVSQISPVDVDIDALGNNMLAPWLTTYLGDIMKSSRNTRRYSNVAKWESDSDSLWRELRISDDSYEARYAVTKPFVAQIIERLLKLDDELLPNESLQDLGLDSLMMIEMKSSLQGLIGSAGIIRVADLAEWQTLHLTTVAIVNIMFPKTSGREYAKLVERNKLIKDDSMLWETTNAANLLQEVPISSVKIVLLTGCTGTVGPYVLHQLSRLPQIQSIYCLVRSHQVSSGRDRVLCRLKELNLLSTCKIEKIITIDGDVVSEHLSLKLLLYHQLASGVEAVFHCAAQTSHMEMYGRSSSSNIGLRATNVTGTQNILQFACSTRRKHLYNASSLLATWLPANRQDNYLGYPETFPKDGDFDEAPSHGYGITKFIVDRLVCQAVERGLPVKSFRFPLICGDSMTGRKTNLGVDHFFLEFIYFVMKCTIPDIILPLHLLPVDVAVRVTLKLFFDENVPSGMFNITNPHARNFTDVGMLSEEFGRILRLAEIFYKNLDNVGNSLGRHDVFRIMSNFARNEGVDQEEILYILQHGDFNGEITCQEILNEPNIRTLLRKGLDTPFSKVPHDDFVAQMQREGNGSVLYKWLDYYSRDDAPTRHMANGTLPLYSKWVENMESFQLATCAKMRQYIPNVEELIPDPLETIRTDLQYAIDNIDSSLGNLFRANK